MSFPEDKSNYEKAILEFPQFVEKGIGLVQPMMLEGGFKSAAICGMGASSMAAELISAVADNTSPIWGVRQYYLPREVNQETLVIVSSYSGNTEETLACYGNAKEETFRTIGISKGGKLEDMCTADKTPFIKYPETWEGFQPRWGFGLSFATLAALLSYSSVIRNIVDDIHQAATKLDVESFREQGKTTADLIYGSEPAIYGPQKLAYLARIWQIDINEDAKVPASWNYFPEVNHYEFTGYTQETGNRIAVMIKDPEDNPRILERMKITKQLLSDKNIKTVDVELPKGSDIYRLFAGVIIGMWTAYHLAEKHGIDPAPTEMVEELKKMLS